MPMSFAAGILEGKTAVVTGGATGIGSHIVRMLGSLGATVGIVSRKEEKLRAAVDAFKSDDGIDVKWRTGDVRDPDAMKAVMADLASELGGIDILICNAAGNFICPTEDLSWNGWRTVIDIDLNGTFNCCQAALPYLKEAVDGGRIVSISATAANFGWPGAAHAGAAKAGIQNLMKTLAVEWGGYGIRANYISPGPIEGTEGVDRLIIAQGKSQEALDKIPLGAFGQGKDIANAVVFLATECGKYVSGAELAVDGGNQWARQ
ncbi:MAG: NAD(P)-dependent dehydrogenase (short-subunit alcohol dehydrogenase family) [Glaciecola sp.]|jgi:NAD(P)-dependent dehydrogenase (short-subunit alcohol dehydrogenase family)